MNTENRVSILTRIQEAEKRVRLVPYIIAGGTGGYVLTDGVVNGNPTKIGTGAAIEVVGVAIAYRKVIIDGIKKAASKNTR